MTTSQTADSAVNAEATAAVEEVDLAAELSVAKQQIESLTEQYMLARADVENIRKRAQDDVIKAHKYALDKLAEALLPVRDSLEMALVSNEKTSLESLQQGVDLTLKQLCTVFEKCQIVAIEPALGERFDPNQHQAMNTLEGTAYPSSSVALVMQKGYALVDRVLRPALVAVAK